MNLEELGDIRFVRTEATTTDGLVVGKYLSREKFERSLPLGPAVSDLVFQYDIAGSADVRLVGRLAQRNTRGHPSTAGPRHARTALA